MFYTNLSEGYFTDGIAGLAPGQTVEIETGKETPKVTDAWKAGWLAQSQSLPINASLVPLLANAEVVKIVSKPKTSVK